MCKELIFVSPTAPPSAIRNKPYSKSPCLYRTLFGIFSQALRARLRGSPPHSLMLGSIMKEYDSGETFFNKPLTEPKGIFKMMRNAER